MNRVKNYMMRTLNSICADEPIEKAIKIMHKTEMTVFPVVDHQNRFLGSIYSKHILNNIIPEKYGFLHNHDLLHRITEASDNMKMIKTRKVEEYMTREITTIKESDRMDDLAHIMIGNDQQYLFVTSKNNKLRGYISRADLLYYLLEVARENEKA